MLFDLRSIPDEKNRPRVYFLQLPLKPRDAKMPAVDVPVCLSYLEGTALKAVRPVMDKVLGGAEKTDEFLAGDTAFKLKESDGVRLLVLFLVLSGSKAPERLAQSSPAIMSLDDEDAGYWVGKLRNLATLPAEKAERIRSSFLNMMDN